MRPIDNNRLIDYPGLLYYYALDLKWRCSLKIREVFLKKQSKNKVAIIRLHGPILFNRTQPIMCPTGWILEQIHRAANDKNVLGILIEISSPGGAIVPSEIIFKDLWNVAHQVKPVVAYITDIGASGGYYVACGANSILAHPSALVGSIGVIFSSLGYSKLLKKLNLEPRVFKSALLKDMGSPLRKITLEEKIEFDALITEYYNNFINAVSFTRNISAQTIINTKSKIMTATEACKISLIDEIGSINDALRTLFSTIQNGLGIDPKSLSIIEYERVYNPLISLIGGLARFSGIFNFTTSYDHLLNPGFYYLWDPRQYEIQ